MRSLFPFKENDKNAKDATSNKQHPNNLEINSEILSNFGQCPITLDNLSKDNIVIASDGFPYTREGIQNMKKSPLTREELKEVYFPGHQYLQLLHKALELEKQNKELQKNMQDILDISASALSKQVHGDQKTFEKKAFNPPDPTSAPNTSEKVREVLLKAVQDGSLRKVDRILKENKQIDLNKPFDQINFKKGNSEAIGHIYSGSFFSALVAQNIQSVPRKKIAGLLLKNKADINFPDCMGETSLHWAVYNKNPFWVQYLIEQKADPTLRNNNKGPGEILGAAHDKNSLLIRKLLIEAEKEKTGPPLRPRIR